MLDDKSLSLRRVKYKVRNVWPIEKKIEVVTKYLLLGSMPLVAEITGVNISVCKVWKTQQWWKDMVLEIQAAKRTQQDTKLSRIIDKALGAIEDRLDNGEQVVNPRTGELVRRPVALRDANNTANTLLQRQAILEKLQQNDSQLEQTQTIQEQLSFLAEEFSKFNNRSKLNAETIEFKEVEDDAVHD